jgi:hypothetical protein
MTTDTTTRPTGPALFPTASGGVLGVSLDTFTDRDGNTDHLVRFEDAGAVVAELTPERARRLAAELERLADTTEPLRRDAFTTITGALGVSLEELAAVAGIDLESATRADEYRLAFAIGSRLGKGVSVGLGDQGGEQR